jgi:hypothetical protein
MKYNRRVYWSIIFGKGLPKPYVSFFLSLSCLVISIPITFNTGFYNTFALWSGTSRIWQYLTFQFCHGEPGNPNIWPFLLTNILFILIFGIVIERLIGSGKFLILCFSTYSVFLIRTVFQSNSVSNGASSICWGYMTFIIPIIIWIISKNRMRSFLDSSQLLAALLALFGLFGLSIILYISEKTIFNSTNMIHLTSILTAIPFFLIWRKEIFQNINKIYSNEIIHNKNEINLFDRISIYLCLAILTSNIFISAAAIAGIIT